MRPDEIVIERLITGKAKASDVEPVDRDAAIVLLYDQGLVESAIVHTIGSNNGTVTLAIRRELARRERRAARNAWVSA